MNTSSRSSKMYSSFCSVTFGTKLLAIDSRFHIRTGVSRPPYPNPPRERADLLSELSPRPALAMLVIAVEPKSAARALPQARPAPVTVGMLMNPRTNDPVLQAVAVGNFSKNLDSLEVRSEIERWSVVRLATVADLLLEHG